MRVEQVATVVLIYEDGRQKDNHPPLKLRGKITEVTLQ